jgi:hypothetical protein
LSWCWSTQPKRTSGFARGDARKGAGTFVSDEAHVSAATPSPPPRKRYKTPARLPIPDPSTEAIEKEHFAKDPDTHEPIKPGLREVRAIIESHVSG